MFFLKVIEEQFRCSSALGNTSIDDFHQAGESNGSESNAGHNTKFPYLCLCHKLPSLSEDWRKENIQMLSRLYKSLK